MTWAVVTGTPVHVVACGSPDDGTSANDVFECTEDTPFDGEVPEPLVSHADTMHEGEGLYRCRWCGFAVARSDA